MTNRIKQERHLRLKDAEFASSLALNAIAKCVYVAGVSVRADEDVGRVKMGRMKPRRGSS